MRQRHKSLVNETVGLLMTMDSANDDSSPAESHGSALRGGDGAGRRERRISSRDSKRITPGIAFDPSDQVLIGIVMSDPSAV